MAHSIVRIYCIHLKICPRIITKQTLPLCLHVVRSVLQSELYFLVRVLDACDWPTENRRALIGLDAAAGCQVLASGCKFGGVI